MRLVHELKVVQKIALDDPDLKPLWDSIAKCVSQFLVRHLSNKLFPIEG
jgi:hypothetical protein